MTEKQIDELADKHTYTDADGGWDFDFREFAREIKRIVALEFDARLCSMAFDADGIGLDNMRLTEENERLCFNRNAEIAKAVNAEMERCKELLEIRIAQLKSWLVPDSIEEGRVHNARVNEVVSVLILLSTPSPTQKTKED